MRLDRDNYSSHRPWIYCSIAVTAISACACAVERFRAGEWPGGGTMIGLVLGILGGAIILFEFLLWPRKVLRSWRLGSAQAWLRAHVWLGLLCAPLLVFHCGFRLGSTLTTLLMMLLAIVVASGMFGLILQQFLPARMLRDVHVETMPLQIAPTLKLLHAEAEQLLATRGTSTRTSGETELLHAVYQRDIAPYLAGTHPSSNLLRSRRRAEILFADLKARMPVETHSTVDTLHGLCETRRQLVLQARLHFWLHSWLCVHLPLSVALLVLMIVHVWTALKYW